MMCIYISKNRKNGNICLYKTGIRHQNANVLSMTAPSQIYVEHQVCLTFQVFWSVFQTELFFLQNMNMNTVATKARYIFHLT